MLTNPYFQIRAALRPFMIRLCVLALAGFGFSVLTVAQTYTFSTVVNFPKYKQLSAVNPYAPTIDAAGNIYGTSYSGGSKNLGTVWKVTPKGVLSVLYSFGSSSTDGYNPESILTRDSAGNLYGTNVNGGSQGHGTIFQLSSKGQETILRNTAVAAGDFLARDSAGNFYGYAGLYEAFELSSTGSYQTLYTFCGACDDELSGGPIVKNGYLYGGVGIIGGFVWELTTAGVETTLYTFTGGADGSWPEFKLTQDTAGNLYGVTREGGSTGNGVVFKIDTTTGAETVLYNFCSLANCSDGRFVSGPVIIDSAGNLYGITGRGGANDTGVVYQITPDGVETVLYNAGSEGAGRDLAIDKSGNLYGTISTGGPYKTGSVYKLTKN